MSFHLSEGRELFTIRELTQEMRHMSDAQFSHHVSHRKNDFAQWIADEFGDEELARRLRSARSRSEMQDILAQRYAEEHAVVEPTRGIDDETFTSSKEEYAARNDALLDKFDEIASRFEKALSTEMPEDLVKRRDDANERYAELRQRTSELRRTGKDTLIASLLLRQVPSKLQLALANGNDEDFEILAVLFKQIDAELREVADAKILDVRKEIEEMAGKDYKEEQKGKV